MAKARWLSGNGSEVVASLTVLSPAENGMA